MCGGKYSRGGSNSDGAGVYDEDGGGGDGGSDGSGDGCMIYDA